MLEKRAQSLVDNLDTLLAKPQAMMLPADVKTWLKDAAVLIRDMTKQEADVPKEKIGIMPCEGQSCDSHRLNIPVVVKRNERGTLSYYCDYCDRSPYAKPKTGQYEEWMAAIKPLVGTPKADPAPAPTPAADAPKSKSILGFFLEE